MQIAPFITLVVVSTYTPGPNNIMAMNSARQRGVLGSRTFILGMATGIFIVMIASGIANFALKTALPHLESVLGAIGAIYMLYLAFKPFFPSKHDKVSDPGESHPFITGMLLQLLNFKLILYAIMLMSAFVLPNYGSLASILAFAFILSLVGLSSLIGWAFCGAIFQKYFSEHELAVNVVMAAALVYCAASVSGIDFASLLR